MEGTYCDLASNPTFCNLPPRGQGEPCESHDDCLSFGATYCDTALSNQCLKSGCNTDVNNCSEGYHCCEFSWWSEPAKLCFPDSVSGGNCPCVTSQNCKEGEYCDLTLKTCVPPPTGQGESCVSQDDCATYEADYCDVDGSSKCLWSGCNSTSGNCSPGYLCCSIAPNLCIPAERYSTDCV